MSNYCEYEKKMMVSRLRTCRPQEENEQELAMLKTFRQTMEKLIVPEIMFTPHYVRARRNLFTALIPLDRSQPDSENFEDDKFVAWTNAMINFATAVTDLHEKIASGVIIIKDSSSSSSSASTPGQEPSTFPVFVPENADVDPLAVSPQAEEQQGENVDPNAGQQAGEEIVIKVEPRDCVVIDGFPIYEVDESEFNSNAAPNVPVAEPSLFVRVIKDETASHLSSPVPGSNNDDMAFSEPPTHGSETVDASVSEVDLLMHQIEVLQNKLREEMVKDVDLDDEDNSSYLKVGALEEQLSAKLTRLREISPQDVPDVSAAPFKCPGHFPIEVAKRIEDLVKKTKECPNFLTFTNIIHESGWLIDNDISGDEFNSEVALIYESLVKHFKRYSQEMNFIRLQDYLVLSLGTTLGEAFKTDPADSDEVLAQKLAQNDFLAMEKMEQASEEFLDRIRKKQSPEEKALYECLLGDDGRLKLKKVGHNISLDADLKNGHFSRGTQDFAPDTSSVGTQTEPIVHVWPWKKRRVDEPQVPIPPNLNNEDLMTWILSDPEEMESRFNEFVMKVPSVQVSEAQ